MHPAIADKREALATLCRRYGVTRLEVFGSATRGDDFDPEKSDADRPKGNGSRRTAFFQ